MNIIKNRNWAKIQNINKYKRNNKNVSAKIPNGTIVMTRDEYFEGQGLYRKPGYLSKGNYRKAVVIDSNKNDELALIILVSSGKRRIKNTNYKYKPRVSIKDNNNNPIMESRKFIIRKDRKGIPKNTVGYKNANNMKKVSIKSYSLGEENRKRLRELKNR